MADIFYMNGVKRGGLNSTTEVRLLLCYLLSSVGPLEERALQEALVNAELVNFFTLAQTLNELTERGLAQKSGNTYCATDKCRAVADTLAYDLPITIRESAVNAVVQTRSRLSLEAENKAIITHTESGYKVTCHIDENGEPLMELSLNMPDSLSAELIRKNFVMRGGDVYRKILELLSDYK